MASSFTPSDPTASSSSPPPTDVSPSASLSSSFSSLSSSFVSTSSSSSSSSSSTSSTSSSSSTTSTSSSSSTSSTSSTSSSPTSTTTTTLSSTSLAPSTVLYTQTITQSDSSGGHTRTVLVTSTETPTPTPQTSSTSASSSSSSPIPLSTSNNGTHNSGGGGLTSAGVTAVAVVVPVGVIAILVFLGIFCWRRRKSKKAAEEMRRKEVEDYGYNPNNDPTLPTVASESGHEMSEDQTSGYRGWGAATASNRKMSTTLSGGLTHGPLSENGSNAYHPGGSPTGQASDAYSGDALVDRRETMTSDDLGALGAAPVAQATQVRRGPSNASSSYSHGGHSDVSDDRPGVGVGTGYDYNGGAGYSYTQHGPYGDGSYGGGQDGMPIVRDVSARRNTRIQQPGNYQQGNSGIAQNF